jgi:uncharacterized FAD-dependent dehydrogenase
MSAKLKFKLSFDQDVDAYLKSSHPEIVDYKILTKSLDARNAPRGKKPIYHYEIEYIKAGEEFATNQEKFTQKKLAHKPIIIGAGPAGLFAALRFQEYGIETIVIERGEMATGRMLHISRYWKKGILNTESNVCYGEGGAGLYSDGKLITRVKSDLIKYVMQKFVHFGAPEETAYISNPHLGSNKIRTIITKMTDELKQQGHEFIYNNRVEKLLYKNDKVIGVELLDGKQIKSDNIILATGHSAKEMYHHLAENGVAMRPKDFAVGVRIEHKKKTVR